MDNRFFSLVIVPDSGDEVKSGSFNFKLIITAFCALIATFFICLFFIIGYHIKLSQENEYKTAKSEMSVLLNKVDSSKDMLQDFSRQLLILQRNDTAYRKFAYMDVLDSEMYQAGIGGHVLVDDNIFDGLDKDSRDDLKLISLDLVTLDSRINVLGESFKDIDVQIQERDLEANNTPSILPTHSYRITEYYGHRIHPVVGGNDYHDAVDLAGNIGDDIFATADGVVEATKRDQFLGNHVIIQHKYGYKTVYGHLSKFTVKPGQEVKKGDVIGAMGNTGRITGVHLHYKISQFGKSVNPINYF